MKRKATGIDLIVPVNTGAPITAISTAKRRRTGEEHPSTLRSASQNVVPAVAVAVAVLEDRDVSDIVNRGGDTARVTSSGSHSSASSSSAAEFDLSFDGLCPAVFRHYLERLLPSQECPVESCDRARGIVTRTFQNHGVRLVFRLPRHRRSPSSSSSTGVPVSPGCGSASPSSPAPSTRAVLSNVTLYLELPKQQVAAFQASQSPASARTTTTVVTPGDRFHHRHHLHYFHAACHQDSNTTGSAAATTTPPILKPYIGPLPPNLAAGHTSIAAIRAHSLQLGWNLVACDDGDDTWPDPSTCTSTTTSSATTTVQPVPTMQPFSPSSPNSFSHEQRTFPASTSSSSPSASDEQYSTHRRAPIFERYAPKEGDFLAEVFYTDQNNPQVMSVVFHRRRAVSEFTRANFEKRKALYDQFFGEFIGLRQDIHPPYIDVLIYKRKFAMGTEKEQVFYTLITNGMSDIPMNTPTTVGINGSAAELVMYVREPHERYVHLLQYLACYPHDENTWLGHGHTISWPHKIHPASELQHFLIATPILRQDRQFRQILSMDGAPVNLFWVLPITNAERNFKRARGTVPLLDLFSNSGEFSWILDERRKSLA